MVRRAALIATCLVSGCSLGYVRPDAPASRPPDQHEAAPARLCTTSMWFPVLDLIGVAASAFMLGLGVSAKDTSMTALGAGATAITTTSAIYGFSTVGACSEHQP
jgi:hypothetical protein